MARREDDEEEVLTHHLGDLTQDNE